MPPEQTWALSGYLDEDRDIFRGRQKFYVCKD